MKRYVSIVLALLHLEAGMIHALPEGGNVVAGEAAITNGAALTVTQTTDQAIIQWNQFNIAAGEQVIFAQPGPNAVALNRVTGENPSSLFGTLTANGQIFLVNPYGIFFGPNARLDVGGLVATTLDIQDADFLTGQYVFQKTDHPSSEVANYGNIKVRDGGFAFLVAPSVVNDGVILARFGTVVLGGVEQIQISLDGTGDVSFVVDDKALNQVYDPSGVPIGTRVHNSGVVAADGGEVVLIAKGASDIVSSVINQSGIIEAKSLVDHGGVIRLIASDPVSNTGAVGKQVHLHEVQHPAGAIIQSGILDVSAAEAGAAAGEITLSGQQVTVSGKILAQGVSHGEDGLLFPASRVLVTSSHRTLITQDAVIDASGRGYASAGNVVLWSDRETLFTGTVLATGGDQGGNGGTLEISGFERLGYAGLVDASAAAGRPGSLLLDPKNITIEHGGNTVPTCTNGGSTCTVPFSGNPSGNSTFDADEITKITNTGTALILQANNNIVVNEAIVTENPIDGAVGGALTLQAGKSITINANITSDDAPITLMANAPSVVSDRELGNAVLTMASGAILNAGGGNISVTLGAGSNSGDILLGNLVTKNNIEITHGGQTGGNILQVPNTRITANSVVLDIAGSGSIGTVAEPLAVAVSGLEARSQAGDIFIASNSNLTIGGAPLADQKGISGIRSGGLVSIVVSGNLTVSEAINAGKDMNLTATGAGLGRHITLSQGAALTGSSAITLRADRMNLQGSISSPSGVVTLAPDTIGRDIDLGSATDSAEKALELSNNELGRIATANFIQIGTKEAGVITISAPINTPAVQGLNLQSGGEIMGQPNASIVGKSLRIDAVGPVTLTHAENDLDTLAVTITSPGKVLTVVDKDDLVLGDSLFGTTANITTNDGAITITTQGNLTIEQNIAAGTAPITLTATGPESRLTNNSVISGSGIILSANQMALAGDTDSAVQGGSGRITLQPTTNRDIVLGPTNDPNGLLALSDLELDRLATTGTLQIGNSGTGKVTIEAPIDTRQVSTVTFVGQGPMNQTAPITEEQLRIQSQGAVTLTDANNNIGVIAGNVTGAGQPFNVQDAGGVQIGSVDGVLGIQTQGGAVDVRGRVTLAGAIEQQFQTDFSHLGEGAFPEIYMDIIAHDFVLLPQPNPCMEGIEFLGAIQWGELCP